MAKLINLGIFFFFIFLKALNITKISVHPKTNRLTAITYGIRITSSCTAFLSHIILALRANKKGIKHRHPVYT